MESPPSLPVLAISDIQQAAALIERLYSGLSAPEEQQLLQRQLFELQKRPEAWGLVAPFLSHDNPNVQFFGAHTAQVKIARDWDLFPPALAISLRDLLLDLTWQSSARGRSKVVLRKLFVALSSLALKLTASDPPQWPDWVLFSVTALSSRGASSEHILDFLTIAIEEFVSSDLLGPHKFRMDQAFRNTIPILTQAITTSITAHNVDSAERRSALRCLEAWIGWGLPANDVTPLIPSLISLLSDHSNLGSFVDASDVLQEILTKSSLADGKGTKVLTEPLLAWISTQGKSIYEQGLGGSIDISHSFCLLLVALGEHSTTYIASHLEEPQVQNYLRLLLDYTGYPGWYGEDEEESEMTLPLWCLLEEALLDSDFIADPEGVRFGIAKAVYSELVCVLKRKCVWPKAAELAHWTIDQKEKFNVYRRDVGDALINAYYILRDAVLEELVSQAVKAISLVEASGEWEEVEAILHCIKCTQEAVPTGDNPHLRQLFGPGVLGRLPVVGSDRVRRTALGLSGEYSSWFTTQDSSFLLGVISYVVSAFSDASLCLYAAGALKELCDANRLALAKRIDAFAQLHANLGSIPDDEKTKVIQSISSVIQALPPEEAIGPVESIVSPIVARLTEALDAAATRPEDARIVCVRQLQALSGAAKGLTSPEDPFFSLEETDSKEARHRSERMLNVREDPRMLLLREAVMGCVSRTMSLWSTDPEISDSLSDLIKAITALPADATLLSLSPEPLLELICLAAEQQTTGVWLSLATMLIIQLDPPSLSSLKAVPNIQSHLLMDRVAQSLISSSLRSLALPGVMESNPDVVQAFFGCMVAAAEHFAVVLLRLPPGSLAGLMQCAIRALSLQERYSLVSACRFLRVFARHTISSSDLSEQGRVVFVEHGHAIMEALLHAIGGIAPRSTIQNLAELLSLMVSKLPGECRLWMQEILFSPQFTHPRATLPAKEKFMKSALSSRSSKKTSEAAHDFALVARGLEGTSFGYTSGLNM